MKYRLGFDIGYDPQHWDLNSFERDRQEVYEQLLRCFKSKHGQISDARLKFPDADSELAQGLIDFAEKRGYLYSIGTFVKYTREEIKSASFVPLWTDCGPLDSNRDGIPLNEYKAVLCKSCGRCDDSQVPNPYRINKKVLKKPPDIFRASNGVIVLSEKTFESLYDEIKQWVSFGEVVVFNNEQVVPCSVKYKRIRPNKKVGMFTSARVQQRCNECGQPTEIRKVHSEDIFEMNKEVVESFNNVSAPIALAGNWFGEIKPGKACDNNWEVFISGALHEKIRKLKLKGFVKADCIIHAADEKN